MKPYNDYKIHHQHSGHAPPVHRSSVGLSKVEASKGIALSSVAYRRRELEGGFNRLPHPPKSGFAKTVCGQTTDCHPEKTGQAIPLRCIRNDGTRTNNRLPHPPKSGFAMTVCGHRSVIASPTIGGRGNLFANRYPKPSPT